ncbi:TonB-dependent siderophore receptor [Sphingomonas sp. Leaf22]|uniref:TonB-dependent siderophore receptor n=1 Tax=Sphingomonas sp. Leaf22 TaxID=1735687 RepID=UPI000ACD5FEB|nr:TonB-dependent receptor [Sphingomonas sp. Leaf22]
MKLWWMPAMTAAMMATPVAAQERPAGDDADIVVEGRARQLYRTTITTVGKSAQDPLDIPQALQVINHELFTDQGARDATDLYRNISGVSAYSYAGVTFRGFRQDESFYDGMRGNPFVGFTVPQLFNIDRVEVLKGPAGLFFGPGAPGGIINYVSKTPSDRSALRTVVTAGNYDRFGISAEAIDRIDADGVVSYRIGGFYEAMQPYRFNTLHKALIGDAGLSIRTNPGGLLTLQVTTYDNDLRANRLRGVLVDDSGRFRTSIGWNANEKSDDLHLASTAWAARYATAIGDAVTLDAGVRSFRSTERQQYHEPRGLSAANPDLVLREFRDQVRPVDGLSFMANATARTTLLGLSHRVQIGGDWYRESNALESRILRAGVLPLSLSNPVYGRSDGDALRATALPFTVTDTDSRRFGVYAQDQIDLTAHLLLVAGVRYDRFEDSTHVATAGRVTANARYEDGDITFRTGAIYRPQDDLSLYVSWSQGFDPQAPASQLPAAGGPFAPITGNQIETGFKSRLLDGRVQANAALYRIVRRNLLQVDPSLPPVGGVDQLRPIGEVTSKGVEIDLTTDLTPDWVLLANYAYNDTRITGSVAGQSLADAIGNRFANAPAHKLGFWTRYQVAPLRTAFAFGGEHVSRRVSRSGQPVLPYTIFDASITRQLGFAELMLRVDNLFDKVYAASGFTAQTGHFPGEPRTAFVELRTKF